MIPVGPSEKRRLAALKLLDIGSEQSENFQRICEIARFCFKVPVATVTIVEEDRLWFKAEAGLNLTVMQRENAFSNYTILNDGPFIVNDTACDRRFEKSPLVKRDPHIRFYAGAPIAMTPGLRIGSLCLVDQKPHQFSGEEAAILVKLADIVVSELRLLTAARAFLRSHREPSA